jgi:hypothetical protein
MSTEVNQLGLGASSLFSGRDFPGFAGSLPILRTGFVKQVSDNISDAVTDRVCKYHPAFGIVHDSQSSN